MLDKCNCYTYFITFHFSIPQINHILTEIINSVNNLKSQAFIKEATKKDAHEIAQIYNHYLGKGTMDLQTKTGEYFYTIIDSDNKREKLFVTIYDDTIVGYGIIKKYSDREGYKLTAETSIYFDKNHIGKGYGKLMQAHLLQEAVGLDYRHLVVKIWSSNTGSIKFHESFGYTIVGQQNKIGFVNGEWQDVTIMQYLVV